MFCRIGDLAGRKYTFLVPIVYMGGATFLVATYGAIPLLLAGALLVPPVMVMLSIVAGLYSHIAYNGGLKRVLRVSETESPILLGIAIIMLYVTSMAIGAMAAGS